LLRQKEGLSDREKNIDLSAILQCELPREDVCYTDKHLYDFKLAETLDETAIHDGFRNVFAKGKSKTIDIQVKNTDRSLGTAFGAEITRQFGDSLADDTFKVICHGAGGQSFGAFIPKGLTLELIGDSNDYFGKGLSGGKLIVYPPKEATFQPEDNIIIGNVALYGATSGSAFINGIAGERFCVRNSGATAVVEGVGDHGCEYMTGGCVVVLGPTGKNFAAGMSGGIAYVLDEDRELYMRLNKELVEFSEITDKSDVMALKSLIEAHTAATGSAKGKQILSEFGLYLPKFKKIIPHDYKRMMEEIASFEAKGFSDEDAKIEAFYRLTGEN
jgi:glutamate synthase (ferredoxin)